MRQALKEGRYVGRQPIGYLPGKDEVEKASDEVDPRKLLHTANYSNGMQLVGFLRVNS